MCWRQEGIFNTFRGKRYQRISEKISSWIGNVDIFSGCCLKAALFVCFYNCYNNKFWTIHTLFATVFLHVPAHSPFILLSALNRIVKTVNSRETGTHLLPYPYHYLHWQLPSSTQVHINDCMCWPSIAHEFWNSGFVCLWETQIFHFRGGMCHLWEDGIIQTQIPVV